MGKEIAHKEGDIMVKIICKKCEIIKVQRFSIFHSGIIWECPKCGDTEKE